MNETISKVTLHTCCAPCLIEPYRLLKAEHPQVIAVFYNPNIAPSEEYARRHDTFTSFVDREQIESVVIASDRERWEQRMQRPVDQDARDADALSYPPETVQRCEPCYRLRMERAIRWAKENACDGFATTLTVSPYQQRTLIDAVARELCEAADVTYVGRDFSAHYSSAQRHARQLGLYRQNYCGCTPREGRMLSDTERIG